MSSIACNRTATIHLQRLGAGHSWKRLPAISGYVVALWLLLAQSIAQADIIAPAGLAPGDQFRLIFVSSTTHDATSADIAVYDAFISSLAAAAGLDLYNGVSVNWEALGSTPTVDAITRLPNSAVPIYDMGGDLVADVSNDIWSGALLHEVAYTETGTPFEGFVRTGTRDNGTTGDPNNALGDAALGPVVGNDILGECCWAGAFPDIPQALYPFYGYSEVITIVPEVPEPGTIILLLTAILLLGLGCRRWRPDDAGE